MTASHLVLAACLVAGLLAGWTAALASRLFAGEAGRGWRRELAVAVAGAILFAWAWAVTPAGPVLVASLVLAWALLALAVIDITVFRLPDPLTLQLIAAGLLVAWRLPAADGVADHVVGALAGYGVLALIGWGFYRLRGREGLGLGDAKLLAAAGAWLGWRALPSVLLLGCLGGLAWWSLARLADRSPARDVRIPFGAPLCAAVWLVWLYGPLELPG